MDFFANNTIASKTAQSTRKRAKKCDKRIKKADKAKNQVNHL
jgi:hypothetical protein